MIAGIGIDIIEISRIKASVEKFSDFFLKKIFTDSEILFCSAKVNKYQHYAARFAAKEAIYKAFPQDVQNRLNWLSIEISSDKFGLPHVNLHNSAKELENQGFKVFISITHSQEYAACVALVQKTS